MTQYLVAWLGALGLVLATAAPARGLVLCIGAGGHVALEAEHAGTQCDGCPETQVVHEHDDAGLNGVCCELPCCPCLDIALPTTIATASNRAAAKAQTIEPSPGVSDFIAPRPWSLAPSLWPMPTRPVESPPRAPATVALLRGVVLII